jgi:MFS family permease
LLLLLAALNGFLGRALVELLPAVSGQLLNGTAQTLAFLTALAGLGSILAGVIIARQRDKQQRFVNIILGSLATTGLLMYALLLPTSLTLVAIVITLLALTMTLVSAGCQAMTQVSVSDAFRGRVMSFWAVIAMGVPAIGAFVLGGMAELMGFPVALSILGTLVLAAVIAVKRKRHLWSNGQQQDVA